MNTYINFELNNGNTIKLTLYLKKLLTLKSSHTDIYNKANNVICRGAHDVFDMIDIIYAAYLCGLSEGENIIPYDNFLEVIPQNIDLIIKTVDNLISPKKKLDLEKLS